MTTKGFCLLTATFSASGNELGVGKEAGNAENAVRNGAKETKAIKLRLVNR